MRPGVEDEKRKMSGVIMAYAAGATRRSSCQNEPSL